MARYDEHWGFKSFCRKKQLDVKQVLDLFCAEKNLPRVGIREYIDNHWKEFASFVNEKLQKKEIKGKNVTTSNGSEEEKQEYRKAMHALDPELRNWWNILKQKDGGGYPTGRGHILSKFFAQHNLGPLPKKDDCITAAGSEAPRFQIIRDNNLLEAFKTFQI